MAVPSVPAVPDKKGTWLTQGSGKCIGPRGRLAAIVIVLRAVKVLERLRATEKLASRWACKSLEFIGKNGAA